MSCSEKNRRYFDFLISKKTFSVPDVIHAALEKTRLNMLFSCTRAANFGFLNYNDKQS